MTYLPEAHNDFFVLFISLLPIAMWFVMLMTAVAVYVLRSLGLYQMAKNTAMPNPWLAWVPIAHEYLAGKMADRYNAARGKKTKYGFWLMFGFGLTAAVYVLLMLLVFIVVFGVALAATVSSGSSLAVIGSFFVLPAIAGFLVLFAVALAAGALRIVAHYFLYRDFEPTRAALYAVLTGFGLDFICKLLIKDNVPVGVAGEYPYSQPKYRAQ